MQKTIQQQLFELQDLKYRDFHAKLVPGMDVNDIIGVRTPELRKLAKQLAKDERVGDFLAVLPHRYLDEMNLHGFIISELKDYNECLEEIERFLPYVNNWATCDLLSPKAFKQKKNRVRLIEDIKRWMASDEPFIIRFGIEMLMSFYLDEDFKPEYLKWVSDIRHEHYYVKMMVAWYFATALAKQWESTLPYIVESTLEKWTHNKAIQKAVDSYRITPEQKELLKSYRVK
ncbi:MAG: DNA alkylation repair protein [Prevotella sp.]|nr:DNA alkylation repair protein [Prevotella sp.]